MSADPAIARNAEELATLVDQVAEVVDQAVRFVSNDDLMLGVTEGRRQEFDQLWVALRRKLDDAGADWTRASVRDR